MVNLVDLLQRFEAFAQELTDDVFLAKMDGKANDFWPKRGEVSSNLTTPGCCRWFPNRTVVETSNFLLTFDSED